MREGGARPDIAPEAPPVVAFAHDFPGNSIVIDTGQRKLYYVLPDKRAYEYAISVGREGFNWTGMETVSRKQAWPDWHPPAEMRERDPKLPEKMTGGLQNPLGAMALYLGNTLYRIPARHQRRQVDRPRRIVGLPVCSIPMSCIWPRWPRSARRSTSCRRCPADKKSAAHLRRRLHRGPIGSQQHRTGQKRRPKYSQLPSLRDYTLGGR